MKKEMLEFIRSNGLSPFNRTKTSGVKGEGETSIFKTKDAKAVHGRVLSVISSNFQFADTSNVFGFFGFTSDVGEIGKRQEFFKGIEKGMKNDFLKEIKSPREWWNPKYGVVVVTEESSTFTALQKLGCPVKILTDERDLSSLEGYDLVQVLDCEMFSRALESLPQSVFLDSIDEAYLERHVRTLSGWKENIDLLKDKMKEGEVGELIGELNEMMELLGDEQKDKITSEKVEEGLKGINQKVNDEMKNITISGESLLNMFSKNSIPEDLMKVIKSAVSESGLPEQIFVKKLPVEINEEELDRIMKKQNAEQHTGVAERIKKRANKLIRVDEKLQRLSDLLVLYDFMAGISEFKEKTKGFPLESGEFVIESSSNLFLDKAQPISFHLNDENRCSILTGANSGGKTTLLEHVIQLISLFQIGLPASGNIKLPMFSEVYYFAKNKGSANKGAFETLLTQMSKIKAGRRTLILADEIESVTEPGVAGGIVCASADFFIKQGCYLIISTHLGKEIEKNLPMNARVDGIEAKGLDEFYELIVDHNPVLGRLANSTPELIVEKMASVNKADYFRYLNEFLKKNK